MPELLGAILGAVTLAMTGRILAMAGRGECAHLALYGALAGGLWGAVWRAVVSVAP